MPVNRGSSPRLRLRDSPPAIASSRRAGCHESGLSGSTEARRRNPSTTIEDQSRRSIRYGSFPSMKWGDGERPRQRLQASAGGGVVVFQSRCKSCPGGSGHNPLMRINSGERLDRLVQPRLAWGVRNAATRATGPETGSGDPLKRRTAKSSTMKGPQGLASEFDWRRCRTAKIHRRRVSGCFSFRPAEIERIAARKLRSGGSLRRTTMDRRVTPASDVTD